MELTIALQFTQREIMLIKLMLLSYNRKIIADKMMISEGTLHNYIQTLYSKTDNHCIEGLIIFLLSNGFAVNKAKQEITFNGTVI